jgi:vitamin B12/bleomycin/antimicrobial peptide transport system ATP-binding/permease protein
MIGFASTVAAIWRLAIPYFRSEERWSGRLLLGAVILFELAIVAIHVLLNKWNSRFFNAIQDRNLDSFKGELLYFCMLAAIFVVLAVYQQYFTQWLRIRWREWTTRRYLARWLGAANHYRMQLHGDTTDNPDQRIAEDIQLFVDRTVSLCTGFLGAVVSLVSFVFILWALSDKAPLHLFGVTVPGYLVWTALLYATFGTVVAHLIGRALIRLNFNQQRFEADFRFSLVRVRESSEQIALLRGGAAEQKTLMSRFNAIAGNWLAIMSRQKLLAFFTAGYNQASHVFPYLVVSPAYFAGGLALGGLTQTASAFGSVQSSLSFFINAYQQLAEWRAVVERLSGFDAALAPVQEKTIAQHGGTLAANGDVPKLRIENLDVRLPDGAPLIRVPRIELQHGEHVLMTGPSGTGKSTLFRAIGGIWPFGSGTVTVSDGAKVMVLPQRPYLPIGSLAAAVAYPADVEDFSTEQLSDALVAVGQPMLVSRLDESAHWGRMLSLGEQQRLAIARAILHPPDFLFLDEATASLDEAAEAAMYRLLHARLPKTTIVSTGHRSTLHAFHVRRLEIAHHDVPGHVREIMLKAAS